MHREGAIRLTLGERERSAAYIVFWTRGIEFLEQVKMILNSRWCRWRAWAVLICASALCFFGVVDALPSTPYFASLA